VSEGTSAGSEDHVGVAQVLKEGWQAQSIHAARNNRGGLLHAFPLLAIVWAISLIILQHEGDVLV